MPAKSKVTITPSQQCTVDCSRMHPQRIQDKRKRNGKKEYESCQQRFDYKQQDPRDASDI